MSFFNGSNQRGQRFLQLPGSKQPATNHTEVPMPRRFKGPFWLIFPALFLAFFAWMSFHPERAAAASPGETPGSLEIVGKDGKISSACPLKHTDVRGAISGFIARVTVTQIFQNPAEQKIEAVYVFPLPDNAAVDDMTIQIGGRTVKGVIKEREEARAIYEKAKQTGHVAALLDQERPNIFTQSVANIMPGEQVTVTISYLQTLQYEAGSYEFVFPMVVGPRYIPGQPIGQQAGGREPDTNQVPDASRITPQITPKGTRAGHDISLELTIDAGVPIQDVHSTLHEIDVQRDDTHAVTVKLRDQNEIPNRDFILKYDVAGAKIEDAVLSQAAPKDSKLGPGGYFTLILQPPARVSSADVTPKELVFVLDTSGSMMGFPIEKAKELANKALDELYPGDTFNIITFAGDTQILFPEPVYPTAANLRKAKDFLNGRSGGGGTEMMKAIRAALDPSDSLDHVRVVCFLTDAYVGNDMEIIGEIQKHPKARVFAFGIGNSVNRFLIEGMAKAGRGDSEIVTLGDKADAAAKRLYERLRSPLLTDVSIDWNGLPVADVYPKRLPDLFSGKPLVVTGRYTAPAAGTIKLRGMQAGEDSERDIPVTFAGGSSQDNVLPSFWARQKIDNLMSQDWAGLQNGSVKPEVQKEITQIGLEYRLMTQFTSFVAVEERVVTTNGVPQRVEVPVEMPEGVSYEGILGEKDDFKQAMWQRGASAKIMVSRGVGAGVASGSGFGGGSIVSSNVPAPGPPPPPMTIPQSINAEATQVAVPKEDEKLTPARASLESKLHPSLLAAYDCWQKSGNSCLSIQGGKIEIQIFLNQNSEAVADALKALGFLASAGTDKKVLSGTLPIEKLPDLVRITQVRFVSLAHPPAAKKEPAGKGRLDENLSRALS